MIMASKAYKDGGVIISGGMKGKTDGEPGDNADDFNHTIREIVISDLAHPNEGGHAIRQLDRLHPLLRSAHHAGIFST